METETFSLSNRIRAALIRHSSLSQALRKAASMKSSDYERKPTKPFRINLYAGASSDFTAHSPLPCFTFSLFQTFLILTLFLSVSEAFHEQTAVFYRLFTDYRRPPPLMRTLFYKITSWASFMLNILNQFLEPKQGALLLPFLDKLIKIACRIPFYVVKHCGSGSYFCFVFSIHGR